MVRGVMWWKVETHTSTFLVEQELTLHISQTKQKIRYYNDLKVDNTILYTSTKEQGLLGNVSQLFIPVIVVWQNGLVKFA